MWSKWEAGKEPRHLKKHYLSQDVFVIHNASLVFWGPASSEREGMAWVTKLRSHPILETTREFPWKNGIGTKIKTKSQPPLSALSHLPS